MISVVILTYKDEKYIREQIESILPQLSHGDEIIVCDDKPGSKSERIISSMAREDSRIIRIEGRGKGKTACFAGALRHCKGDKIFICEKGNVWLPDKVSRVMEGFRNGAGLVVHNAYITDDVPEIKEYSLFEKAGVKKGVAANLRKSSYIGCCMAFDRKLLKKIMPIPAGLPDYARWVGLVCEFYGKTEYIDLPLMYYRGLDKETDEAFSKTKKRFFTRRYIAGKLYKRVFFGN